MNKSIKASDFKARCLDVLDQVAANGQSVIVTKRGKPVARVVPMVAKPSAIVGALKGEIEILGDIVSPLDMEWKAAKR